MIKSMTAFARAEKSENQMSVQVEIRSFNSKYLDIVTRIPQIYMSLEERVKSLIATHLTRGRVEVRISIKNETEGAVAFELDVTKAKAYYDILAQLKTELNLSSEIAIEQFLGAGGFVQPAEVISDLDKDWHVIQASINMAMVDLVAMRKKEGDFISDDMKKRLDHIENSVATIEKDANNLVPIYQERLKERITSLTRGLVEIDPARIAQEAAFLADRSDITEEITRAQSHLAQFRTIMQSDEPAGRKLNFLLQEFNREFNTMSAKVGNATLSHIIVNAKAEIEKLREQVQNVE